MTGATTITSDLELRIKQTPERIVKTMNEKEDQEKTTGEIQLAIKVSGSCSQIHNNDASNKPELTVFLVVVVFNLLTVTALTIAIPTSEEYTSSFGMSPDLGGLLVGLLPYFSALAQPLVYPLMARYEFQHILATSCVIAIIANVLYALAPRTSSFYTLLVSRAIMGMVSGPSFTTTFIARTTGVKARSKYMMLFQLFESGGYVCGPLLGLACVYVCNAAGWQGELVNTNTAPGWLMAILFVVELALVIVVFWNKGMPPPKPQPTPAVEITENQPQPLPWSNIVLFYALMCIAPINVESWEVISVFRAANDWGFDIEYATVGLIVVNFACVIVGASYNPSDWLKDDRLGVLVSFGAAIIGAIGTFMYPLTDFYASVVFYIGGFVLLFGIQSARGFAFSINSKWSHDEHQRQRILMFNNMIFMGGRGTGAIVAPYLADGQGYGAFLIGINLFCVVIAGITYKMDIGPKR